tara:strand:+ start:270 stop:509 length:240 start_codon:yes stop_codon:yes gene_type:complete
VDIKMKTVIHVNQHNIKANAKGANTKVLTVKTYKKNTKCNEVKFTSGRIVYSPDKPLSCGAKVWIETYEPVEIIGDSHV